MSLLSEVKLIRQAIAWIDLLHLVGLLRIELELEVDKLMHPHRDPDLVVLNDLVNIAEGVRVAANHSERNILFL